MKRIFRVLGEGWQNSRRRWAYESYYLSPVGQPRSPLGARVDYWGLRVLIWLGAWVLSLLAFSPGWWGGALIATVITMGIHYSLKKSRRRRLSQLVAERRRLLAQREVIGEWLSMEPEQFAAYLADLLARLPGFAGVKARDQEEEEGWLEALWEGKPALILGMIRGEKEEVGVRELRVFHRAVLRKGRELGLLVTTGKFTPEAMAWADKKATGMTIYLLDGEALLTLLEKKGLLPGEDRIDALVDREIQNPTAWAFYRQALQPNKITGRKKGRAFLYTGMALTFMAFLPGWEGFRYLYLGVACINFALGIWAFRPSSPGQGRSGIPSFLDRPEA